jgi:hypothetical protein
MYYYDSTHSDCLIVQMMNQKELQKLKTICLIKKVAKVPAFFFIGKFLLNTILKLTLSL